MKIAYAAGLMLFSAMVAVGQEPSNLFDKAPGPIDEALRARVNQFYQAYMAGKFRDAYNLVADDSQDAFLSSDKATYQNCETLKITYSENFTQAKVLESCLGEIRFHGQRFESKMPLTTSWKVVNGQWYWSYVKPTVAATPFSPTGFVTIPNDQPADAARPSIPKDPLAEARSILGKVKVDKTAISLRSFETSKDEVHVRNDMPGGVTISVDTVTQPGLRITVAKPNLGPHEETAVTFEYRLDDAAITCGDCASRLKGSLVAQVRVIPTNQLFSITVTFSNPPDAQKPLPLEPGKKRPN